MYNYPCWKITSSNDKPISNPISTALLSIFMNVFSLAKNLDLLHPVNNAFLRSVTRYYKISFASLDPVRPRPFTTTSQLAPGVQDLHIASSFTP